MHLKKVLIRTLLLAFPCAAFAASTDATQIERIATQEDGTVILYAKNGWGAAATVSGYRNEQYALHGGRRLGSHRYKGRCALLSERVIENAL
jgi:hypothetical protein